MVRSLPMLLLLLPLLARGQGAEQRFVLDRSHSQLMFQVSHLGLSHSMGWFRQIEGSLVFDRRDWSRSRVEVEIDIAGLDLGDARWNRMMLGPRFFHQTEHPRARFVSTRVEQTGADTGLIDGELTLLGQSHPLQLQFRHNGSAINRFSQAYTLGFSATAVLERSRWGMTALVPDVGDRVYLHIEVEAVRERLP